MSVQHDVAKIVVKKELPRVGIIGLGMIGGGVAVSLERSGRKATVYDVNPVAAQNLPVDLPMAESAAAVARNSDVVILAVVNADLHTPWRKRHGSTPFATFPADWRTHSDNPLSPNIQHHTYFLKGRYP